MIADREDGPHQTLEAFVTAHYRRLVRLAALVCIDQADAQDAVQNGLLRAWRHQRDLRDSARLKSWLDAIVVREAIRLNGRGRTLIRRVTRRLTAADERLPAPVGGSAEFAAALRSLPAAQRAAVALHYEAGYTVAETAELVGAPIETVRSRLRIARERLRRQYEEVDDAARP